MIDACEGYRNIGRYLYSTCRLFYISTGLKYLAIQTLVLPMQQSFCTHFSSAWLTTLIRNQNLCLRGDYNGIEYNARIVIPDYRSRIEQHYRDIVGTNLATFCQQAGIPMGFQHFGLEIAFSRPVELVLHNHEMELLDCLRSMIQVIGPVIIKNGYHQSALRSVGHRNKFPHLNFHVDRTANQVDHFSMYSRDPFDPEQKYPRTVSTLMCANIVGHLQSIREGVTDKFSRSGLKGTYTIFKGENMEDVLGNIVLQQAWTEPEGTGEIAIQDNLTCLHASYYDNPAYEGYKIGVRYVA